MKQILKTVFFLLLAARSFAQQQQSVDTWLYGVSIEEPSKIIHERIDGDARFNKVYDKEYKDSSGAVNYFSIWKAKDPVLANHALDSTRLDLTFGTLRGGPKAKPGDRLQNLRMFIVEYFSNDEKLLDSLYNIASHDFKAGAKKKKYISDYSATGPGFNGKGIQVYYENRASRFRKVSLYKKTGKGNIISLRIENTVYDRLHY